MRAISPASTVAALGLATATLAAGRPSAPLKRRPADAVVAGTTCMDRFEASVWRADQACQDV